MTDLEKIKEIIKNSDSVVFFGGAGVSTGSGIPDFRGSGGLYTEDYDDTPPEEILHISYLMSQPHEFYKYYRANMIYPNAEPNDAHKSLAKLEEKGKLDLVITQNIDGLHQRAGNERVVELHGSVDKNYCIGCGKKYDLDYILDTSTVPYCEDCGEMVRPDVVMYGESLDPAKLYRAVNAIYDADVFIVGGTSLTVNPAASLVKNCEGKHLIIINRDPTNYDCKAELVIRGNIGEVLSQIEVK
jgi:NAD-dependent deacetylase